MAIKNKVYTIFIYLLFSLSCFSQGSISLIKIDDLTFHNQNEKHYFEKFNGAPDFKTLFGLLFNSFEKEKTGNLAEAIKKVEFHVAYLKKEVIGLSDVKKVKYVYKYIHKHFLKVYKLNNSFVDIFESGEYNCVSASALYALVFDQLEIPYQVREIPQHVYLLAYPNSSKIVVETTSPTKGYFQFNSSFMAAFAKKLVESKIITKQEYESTSADALFNKYYFSSTGINLIELAGLQYSNFAIYNLGKNEYKAALEEAKKAIFLFPGDRNKYLFEYTVAVSVDKLGYETIDNVNNLSILCRFHKPSDYEIKAEFIQNEFYKIINAQLIKNLNYELLEKSFNIIYAEISDSVLKNEIALAYYYEIARVGLLNSKNIEFEIENLSKAYSINIINANTRSLILGVYVKYIDKFSDSRSIIEKSDMFANTFDFLKTNDIFLSIKANCYLDLAYQSYYLGELAKGDKHIQDFENLMKSNTEIEAKELFIEKAYAQAAVEYYKKGNKAKAKQFLNNGIKYAPYSFGLMQRLKSF